VPLSLFVVVDGEGGRDEGDDPDDDDDDDDDDLARGSRGDCRKDCGSTKSLETVGVLRHRKL